MGAFSTADLVASAVLLLAVAIGLSLLFISAGRAVIGEKKRLVRWQNDYFQGGGLVRTLMSRWSRQHRLTDQRGPVNDG